MKDGTIVEIDTSFMFNNQYDTPELLADYLRRYFTEVEVWLRGEVILFIAKHPKRL